MEITGQEEARPAVPLPPPVQELTAGHGARGYDVPARYVARAHHNPEPVTAYVPVPVIDLSRLQPAGGESAAADEAARHRSALQSWGLFQVTNHGVEASLMDAVMDASREFFRQPLEEKQRHTNLVDGEHFQLEGYGNDRVVSEDQPGPGLVRPPLPQGGAPEREEPCTVAHASQVILLRC
jgi:hypothetical protein